jgi:hypothetical protein
MGTIVAAWPGRRRRRLPLFFDEPPVDEPVLEGAPA